MSVHTPGSPEWQDGYREGYGARRRYTAHRDAKVDRLLTVWDAPDGERVRGLVEKHWPDLVWAVGELREVEEPARPCPHGPHCDPSEELVNPGDPYTTHLVCLVHDQDHPDTDGDPR